MDDGADDLSSMIGFPILAIMTAMTSGWTIFVVIAVVLVVLSVIYFISLGVIVYHKKQEPKNKHSPMEERALEMARRELSEISMFAPDSLEAFDERWEKEVKAFKAEQDRLREDNIRESWEHAPMLTEGMTDLDVHLIEAMSRPTARETQTIPIQKHSSTSEIMIDQFGDAMRIIEHPCDCQECTMYDEGYRYKIRDTEMFVKKSSEYHDFYDYSMNF